MARLATYVHVHKDGSAHLFGPDDEVPAWAAVLITNPLAWDEPPAQADLRTEPVKAPAKRAATRRKAAADDDAVQRG